MQSAKKGQKKDKTPVGIKEDKEISDALVDKEVEVPTTLN